MYYYCFFFLTKMGGSVGLVTCNALDASALEHEQQILGRVCSKLKKLNSVVLVRKRTIPTE
jgi:hypothetical protein